jgi:hypothetical protein
MLTNFRSKPIAKRLIAIVAVLMFIPFIIGAWQATPPKTIWDWQDPPKVNITRGDYEGALARWRALKVEEYEITTDTKAMFGGRFTLRVSENGKKLEVLGPTPKARPLSTVTAESIEYFRNNTVEGLFAEVGAILEDSDVIRSPASSGSGCFYMAYQVQFHPSLGYPKRIIGRPITEPGSYVNDLDWDLTVTSLKIIKQGK